MRTIPTDSATFFIDLTHKSIKFAGINHALPYKSAGANTHKQTPKGMKNPCNKLPSIAEESLTMLRHHGVLQKPNYLTRLYRPKIDRQAQASNIKCKRKSPLMKDLHGPKGIMGIHIAAVYLQKQCSAFSDNNGLVHLQDTSVMEYLTKEWFSQHTEMIQDIDAG